MVNRMPHMDIEATALYHGAMACSTSSTAHSSQHETVEDLFLESPISQSSFHSQRKRSERKKERKK